MKTNKKKKMKKTSYQHYMWQPFALMDLHLFIFDNQCVRDHVIWKHAFHHDDYEGEDHQYPGMTLFDETLTTYTCAISLMKMPDGSVDMSTIVHECVHASQHYVNMLQMNSKNEQPTNGEFAPELCSSLVIKVLSILSKEKVRVINVYDDLNTTNIVKCRR